MNPAEIVTRLTADELELSVSGDGDLKIKGDQNMIDSWLETIAKNKLAILAELGNAACNVSVTPQVTQQQFNDKGAPLHSFSLGREVILSPNLPKATDVQQPFNERSIDSKYSVTVTDASTDPILVEVTIRGLASFQLEIPKAKYDCFSIIEAIDGIDHYSPLAALEPNTDTFRITRCKRTPH